jgi:hypothetical protein
MKFNWGHGIAIFFVLFVCTLVYFVLLSTTKKFDLQTEDYYHEEIHYQEMIDKKKNAKSDSLQIEVTRSDQGISIQYPDAFEGEVTGNILFYRPSNSDLDFQSEIEYNGALTQTVKTVKFKPGLYTVKFDFSINQKEYYLEKDLFY